MLDVNFSARRPGMDPPLPDLGRLRHRGRTDGQSHHARPRSGRRLATLLMGIGGTFIGCSVLMYCTGGQRISPMSPMGFVVGTAGAFVILFFYRLLGGGHGRSTYRAELSGPHFAKSRSSKNVEQD